MGCFQNLVFNFLFVLFCTYLQWIFLRTAINQHKKINGVTFNST